MSVDLNALARASYRCETCGEPAGVRCIVVATGKPTRFDHVTRSDALREAWGDGYQEGYRRPPAELTPGISFHDEPA